MPAVSYLLQIRVRKLLGQRLEVVLDAADWRNRVDLDAANALGGEDAVRRVRIDDARNQNVRECRQRFSERRGVARLGPVIELVDQCFLDLLDDANQVDAG